MHAPPLRPPTAWPSWRRVALSRGSHKKSPPPLLHWSSLWSLACPSLPCSPPVPPPACLFTYPSLCLTRVLSFHGVMLQRHFWPLPCSLPLGPFPFPPSPCNLQKLGLTCIPQDTRHTSHGARVLHNHPRTANWSVLSLGMRRQHAQHHVTVRAKGRWCLNATIENVASPPELPKLPGEAPKDHGSGSAVDHQDPEVKVVGQLTPLRVLRWASRCCQHACVPQDAHRRCCTKPCQRSFGFSTFDSTSQAWWLALTC